MNVEDSKRGSARNFISFAVFETLTTAAHFTYRMRLDIAGFLRTDFKQAAVVPTKLLAASPVRHNIFVFHGETLAG
jgi:hypothetical protein